jgi:membrane protease subunit (stomatin/prohibitin family)
MDMRATRGMASEQTKQMQMQAQKPDPSQQQPCSLCSGELVMDAQGTALFCDACWDRKWFLALESD